MLLLTQCTPKTGDKTTSTTTTTPTTTSPKPEEPKVTEEKPVTFRSMAPAPGPAPRIQMGSYEQFQLDNGLQVILVENHKLPRVSYQLYVDVPPLSEGDKTGTITMAGDMLSKGTSSKSKSEIDETIDFMGASLSTNGSGVSGTSLKKYNTDLLALMSDVLLRPSFPESEFDKMKKTICFRHRTRQGRSISTFR